ncbi:MAG: group II intron reverse transcriptase/maturase [Candidatus Wallbacteria bacterium]|nr:group II intron reverse transcriptase/maturase [Candidatus Wallbacteria bacterium]
MRSPGKSDCPIVPAKSPNKAGAVPAAEEAEGRGRTKGNLRQPAALRTLGRAGVSLWLARVRHAAERNRKERFTALLHHIYAVTALREAYYALAHSAAPGVDGETWKQYGENLEENLRDLSARLKRGAYRAKPVRRVYIPKADGRQRPLGIPALEDKVVQRATVEVLNAIYEVDFLGFSYGFRSGRSQHNALDALHVGMTARKVFWLLDADIRGYFDAISHEWLMKFLEHRIADRRVLRLISEWLKAGVLEDGKWTPGEEGTPQGGSISPLLANIYLHYAFDLWAHRWRKTRKAGEVIIVRYADDFIVGFQYKSDAEQFLEELRERFERFNLELHPDKTRLIEFGRFAAVNRARRGEGKPETFDFLGFTHLNAKTHNGRYIVLRQTMRKRLRAKLHEVKAELKRRLHDPIKEVGKWLRSVVTGHFQYYGVPFNTPALQAFRSEVGRLWRRALSRRSQKGHVSWERMKRLIGRWLPSVRLYHSYPRLPLGVTT